MPRLVLEDDVGRVMFDAQISTENVAMIARLLQRNMPAIRAAAVGKRAIETIIDQVGQLGESLAPLLELLEPRKKRPPSLPRGKARR